MINGEIRTGSNLTPYFRKEAALKRRCPNCGAVLDVVQRVDDDSNGAYICPSCKWHQMEQDPDVPHTTEEWLKTRNLLFKGLTQEQARQWMGAFWKDAIPGEGMRKKRQEEKQKAEAAKRCHFLTPEFGKKR